MDTKVGIEPTPMGLQPISPPRGTWCMLFKTLFFFSLVYTQNICIKKKDLLYVSFLLVFYEMRRMSFLCVRVSYYGI